MICPNCGKNISAQQEVCQFCGQPTQFSSKVRYFPKEVPVRAAAAVIPQQAAPVQGQPTQNPKDKERIASQTATIQQQKKVIVMLTIVALVAAIIACLAGILLACNSCSGEPYKPAPTPVPPPTAEPTPYETAAPVETPMPEQTDTATEEPTPTPTPALKPPKPRPAPTTPTDPQPFE